MPDDAFIRIYLALELGEEICDRAVFLSWVMLQSECDRSLYPMYEGLSQRCTAAGVEKAGCQWVDRDCCAAFRVLHHGAQEQLSWDCWRTSEATVAEATSGKLANNSASRSKFNSDTTIKLDLFHCMQSFTRECVSEHHSLYNSFCQFLSAAFLVVDQGDLQRLKEAYTFCGISPANPTKQHMREHCRTRLWPLKGGECGHWGEIAPCPFTLSLRS